jgi:hypothetical protein
MGIWAVWQVDRENPKTRREIGELIFTEDGTVDINSSSKEFLNFMNRIEADPLLEEEEVSPTDPDFDVAFADFIMQRSEYRYVLEPLSQDDDGDGAEDQEDDEDGGGQLPLYPAPPPPKGSYSKVRRLGKD